MQLEGDVVGLKAWVRTMQVRVNSHGEGRRRGLEAGSYLELLFPGLSCHVTGSAVECEEGLPA